MSLGPLTTAFVPAPGCNDTIYGKIYSDGTVSDKWHSLGLTNTTSCYPTSFTENAYYSPGLCPSNWSSACDRIWLVGSTNTETRVTCCPAGYVCSTTTDTLASWNAMKCRKMYTTTPMPTITVPQDESATTNYVKTMLGPNVEVFAQHIEVRYKNGDLEIDASTTKIASSRLASLTSAAPSRPTLSENETSATSGNPAETSGANGTGTDDNASVAKHEEKKGLTASAYAGIGVGIAVALVALVGTSLYFLRRRNKTKKPTETAATGWRQMPSAAEIANSTPVCEVGLREAAEVRGDHALPAELDPNRVHQLE